MKLFAGKETEPLETRVPLLPVDAGKLTQIGLKIEVESGIGESIGIADQAYEKAGVQISGDRRSSLLGANIVLRMSVPSVQDINDLAEDCIHISCLDPFNNLGIIRQLADRKVTAISLEMIPRSTITQKMDVLTSQANLAGYVAVILSAERQKKIFPMMMTPAGTILPMRVFVIGAGIAGLQAIATAKRLGARVEAFDVRPQAQEQIMSLGAKPLKIDLGEIASTKDGYARQLTNKQLEIQRQALAKQCAISDVVITTAKIFGKVAPLIVTNDMLDGMKPGSVVIDLSVETGGNVEAAQLGKEIDRKGVTIIGFAELQRRVPLPASEMFSSNIYNFVEHFWDKSAGGLVLDRDDEIMRGCLVTLKGEIVNEIIMEVTG